MASVTVMIKTAFACLRLSYLNSGLEGKSLLNLGSLLLGLTAWIVPILATKYPGKGAVKNCFSFMILTLIFSFHIELSLRRILLMHNL